MNDQDVRDAEWAAAAVEAMLERVRKLCWLAWMQLAQELGPR